MIVRKKSSSLLLLYFLISSLFFFKFKSVFARPLISSKRIVYGKSQKGSKLFADIHFLEGVSHIKAAILTSGVHGNEYMPIVNDISTFIKKNGTLNTFDYFKTGGVLITIPKVNPDGIEKSSRYLASGEDLNRHFYHTQDSHEKHLASEAYQLTSFVKDFLKETNLKLIFATDYHCCGNAALIPTKESVSNFFYKFLKETMQIEFGLDFSITNTARVFGKTFKGTLKDYWNQVYNIPSITFEAKSLKEIGHTQSHIKWLNKIFSFLGEKVKAPAHLSQDISRSRYFKPNYTVASRFSSYSE